MIYLILKLIHIFGAIMFLGNITVGPFWKMHAEHSKDQARISSTFDGIIKADKYYTMPGVAIIIIFGIGAALHGGYNLLNTAWILWSIILIIISGAAFMTKVVPLQKKIYRLASSSDFTWDEYKKLSKQWDIWGSVATIAPYIALVLMVLKPA